MSFSGIGATFYNRRNSSCKSTAEIYNLITLGAVFICWLIKFLINPVFDPSVLIYSLIFTAGYTTAMISSVSAYREGPVMLSSLIMQLSLISTTIWGFFFWNSEVTVPVIIGLVLVVIALVLCLYNGKEKGSEKKKINAKWLIFITLF
jgi:drug/metabolite transporter (DMT)-like permease